MKNFPLYLILLFILLNCKDKTKNSNDKADVNVSPRISQTADIYIGKKFYEGDELTNYTFFKGGFLTKDSLISYSIYENNLEYVYSIEEQISFEDLREYVISDTLRLSKKTIKNLFIHFFPLNENKKILTYHNEGKKKNIYFDIKEKKILK